MTPRRPAFSTHCCALQAISGLRRHRSHTAPIESEALSSAVLPRRSPCARCSGLATRADSLRREARIGSRGARAPLSGSSARTRRSFGPSPAACRTWFALFVQPRFRGRTPRDGGHVRGEFRRRRSVLSCSRQSPKKPSESVRAHCGEGEERGSLLSGPTAPSADGHESVDRAHHVRPARKTHATGLGGLALLSRARVMASKTSHVFSKDSTRRARSLGHVPP